MNKLPAIICASMALLLWGCNSGSCYDNGNSIPLAEYRSSQTGKSVVLSGIQISGIGAPGDSVLQSYEKSTSQVYLPMRSTAQSVAWLLKYKDFDDVADTVSFTYTSEPYFASEECGAMYRYNITQVRATANVLDSVVVLDSLITNVDIVRIALYFNTETNQGQ